MELARELMDLSRIDRRRYNRLMLHPDRLQVASCGHFANVPEHYQHRAAAPNNLLIWVTGGFGFLRTEGFDGRVGPGALLSLREGPAHAYGSDAAEPWNILWVHFEGGDAADWVGRIRGFGDPVADLGVDERLRARWLEMVAAFRGPLERDQALAHHLLVGLLGLIVHRLEAGSPARRGRHVERLAAVQAYVQAHLDESMSVDDLAAVAHLSPAQLTRVMKEQMGCPPMSYVLDQRVAQACALLRETAQPVKQVAAAVGYDDPYHFSRLFRNRIGRSPARYRERQA